MATRMDLVRSVASASLEEELRARLRRVGDRTGPLGPLAELAVRLGLIQGRLVPRISAPSLVIFAGDHGLAVDNIAGSDAEPTHDMVSGLVAERLPLASLTRSHAMTLMVVDSGTAETIPPHDRLHARKIAHGTRNSRLGNAMSIEQVQAAIRAGLEIGELLEGNAVGCAGIGVGSEQSAALVLSALSNLSLRELVNSGSKGPKALLEHRILVLESARQRHRHLTDPIELLAAMGGFEVAMMAGLMLSTAARRFVIVPDGLPACAALLLASALAPAVVEYSVVARGHRLPALHQAQALSNMKVDLAIDLNAIDGTGAALMWPLIRSAAGLLAGRG